MQCKQKKIKKIKHNRNQQKQKKKKQQDPFVPQNSANKQNRKKKLSTPKALFLFIYHMTSELLGNEREIEGEEERTVTEI